MGVEREREGGRRQIQARSTGQSGTLRGGERDVERATRDGGATSETPTSLNGRVEHPTKNLQQRPTTSAVLLHKRPTASMLVST